MDKRQRRLMAAICAVVALCIVVAALALGGVNSKNVTNASANGTTTSTSAPKKTGGSSTSSSSSSTTSTTAPPEPEQSLFVDPSKVATDFCVKLVTKYGGQLIKLSNGTETPVFEVGAEHPGTTSDPTVVKKLWTDGVNIPLNPQTVEAEQAVICRDPGQAAMVMNGIGSQSVNGITVASQNPWMKAQGQPSAIAPWAQGCKTDDEPTHIQCEKVMSYAATLVGLFFSPGVQTATSAWNYHLANLPLVVGTVPAFEFNPVQEMNGQWLVIQVTSKTGQPILCMAFNVGTTTVTGGDQRLAGLQCALPPPPATTTTTASGSSPPHSNTTTPHSGSSVPQTNTTTATTAPNSSTSTSQPNATTSTTGRKGDGSTVTTQAPRAPSTTATTAAQTTVTTGGTNSPVGGGNGTSPVTSSPGGSTTGTTTSGGATGVGGH